MNSTTTRFDIILAAANASTLPLGPCGRQDFALWYTAPVLPLPVLRYRARRPPYLRRQHPLGKEEEEEEAWRRQHPPLEEEETEAWGGPWVRRAGLVLLGEWGKWVPLSPQRVAGVRFSVRHTTLLVSVVGAPGERVVLAAAVGWEGEGEGGEVPVTQMLCDVGVDGRADLRVWLVEGGGERERGPAEVAWECQGRIEGE